MEGEKISAADRDPPPPPPVPTPPVPDFDIDEMEGDDEDECIPPAPPTADPAPEASLTSSFSIQLNCECAREDRGDLTFVPKVGVPAPPLPCEPDNEVEEDRLGSVAESSIRSSNEKGFGVGT